MKTYEMDEKSKLQKARSERWNLVIELLVILYQLLLISMIVVSSLVYPSVPDAIIVLMCIMYLSFMIGKSINMYRRRRMVTVIIILLSTFFLTGKSVLIYLLYNGTIQTYDRQLWISLGITINQFQIDAQR